MARKRPARPAARRPKTAGDSSKPSGLAAGPEESRPFSGVDVSGRPQGWRVPSKPLSALLGAYLKGLGLPRAQLCLRLVGDAESRRLNRRFRGIDAATDILSFPALAGRPPRDFDGYLGDLALALPYSWAKRGRFAPAFGGEAAFLILHGLLHLCGQHHDSPVQDARMWRTAKRLHPLHQPFLKDLAALRPTRKP